MISKVFSVQLQSPLCYEEKYFSLAQLYNTHFCDYNVPGFFGEFVKYPQHRMYCLALKYLNVNIY